jgi:ornithine cyclodeaminase
VDRDPPAFLSDADLRAALPPEAAVAALRQGLLARAQQEVDPVPRWVLELPANGPGSGNEMILMPTFGPEGAGTKLVTLARDNHRRGLPMIQGLYVLFSPGGLIPELLIDGAALTRVRTAAVSALATAHLARSDSRRLVVFGAGAQAVAHVEAMLAVVPIDVISIVGSSVGSPRAAELVANLRGTGIEARLGRPEIVAEADVVCTCTTSTTPVFDHRLLRAGAHINAIGAYRLDMCELPAALLARSLLVVETEAAALAEAGDIVQAIAAGALPGAGFARELHQVVSGDVRRESAEQVTVFKSVGLSVEDLILARAAADEIARR